MVDQKIFVIIDGSGSMGGVKEDVVDGINTFIAEQQADVKAANEIVHFSLTTFDGQVNEVYINENIELVTPVTTKETYLGGSTALLDAIGKTLTTAELDPGMRNLVVVYTDGHENASREYNHKQIAEMIKNLSDTGSWQFVYLGAEFEDFNKDEVFRGMMQSTGGIMGNINTSKSKVSNTWGNVSGMSSYYRQATPNQMIDIASRGLIETSKDDAGIDWEEVKE